MSEGIPADYLDLFSKKAFASLATVMSDGSPQVTPVWVDFDGEFVRVNSALGRVKDRNMRERPQVALSIRDPDNPYRYIEVRGCVVDISSEGADEHIDSLAKKYMGWDSYPYRQPGEVRVVYCIRPLRVVGWG